MENNQSFEYTYSAEQKQEIEAIRKKYLPKEEDKMEQLRRLHAIPTRKAKAASIALGVLGSLILGTGMSLCMSELGAVLGHLAMVVGILVGVLGLILGTGMSLTMTELGSALGHWAMVIGILVGVLGLILVALAYPIYNWVLRNERQRIAPEILRLSEELLR